MAKVAIEGDKMSQSNPARVSCGQFKLHPNQISGLGARFLKMMLWSSSHKAKKRREDPDSGSGTLYK